MDFLADTTTSEIEANWFTADFSISKPHTDPFLDASRYLSPTNQTLSLCNNHASAWQKDCSVSVSYQNRLGLNEVTTTNLYHPASLSKLIMWLAYEETPFTPFYCPLHQDPFSDALLNQDKITYRLKCGAECLPLKPKCIVIVEYDVQGLYRWNCVAGNFAKTKTLKREHLELQQTHPVMNESFQIHLMHEKLDCLTKEVKNLQHLVQMLSDRQK